MLDELLKEKLMPKNDELIKKLPYKIITEPVVNDFNAVLPPSLIEELYNAAIKGGVANIKKISRAIKKYSATPTLLNYLYVANKYSGNKTEAKRIAEATISKFPEYLFGRTALAEELLITEEYDKIPDILGSTLELQDLYPNNKQFHITEFNSFYTVVGSYYVAINDLEKAEYCLSLLENSPATSENVSKRVKFEVLKLRSKQMFKRMGDDKNRTISVEITQKKIGEQQTQKCKLNHKICYELYNYEYDKIPHKLVAELKKLPHDTLTEDLLSIIKDAILRFDTYSEVYNELDGTFAENAINFLTEIDDGSHLQDVLDFFRQSKDFLEFWLNDYPYNFNKYIRKFAFNKQEELKNFILEPNVAAVSKDVIIHTITDIAINTPDKREELIEYLFGVFTEYEKCKDNKNILDSNVVNSFISAFIDLYDNRANMLIKNFFDMGIVPLSYNGNYDEIVKCTNQTFEERQEEIRNLREKFNIGENSEEKKISTNSEYQNEIFQNEIFQNNNATVKKVERNDPCPCGSGKKYKKCCLKKK